MHTQKTRFHLSRLTGMALLTGVFALGMLLSTTTVADDESAQRYQTSNIVDFHTGVPVGGAATLFRSENSVSAQVHTSGLQKKAAYTIWWVIWNDPSNCMAGCGEDDIGVDGNVIFYAGGFVTGTDGTANVQVAAQAGDLADGVEDLLGEGGLDEDNGLVAEVHLVIRSHGKIIPGLTDLQIGSFDGACDVNVCDDQQAAVFLP